MGTRRVPQVPAAFSDRAGNDGAGNDGRCMTS
eukprot:CAMPEP_0183356264 /NCGR_PEP_ID=MMETSP0164_2-20130417/43806_1 /TAXON_ID=221442 /ORGANISM="Coccolithus pelagicus ssp braarudi, Strain PLY182g" /LENGTH=31 /DNA_ID= /DNA_START= /DNA_END= /DNA_ORIENTATION=